MKIVAFVIAMVFFVGGILLMGYSFESESGLMFFAGILGVGISLFLPFHILKALDRQV